MKTNGISETYLGGAKDYPKGLSEEITPTK